MNNLKTLSDGDLAEVLAVCDGEYQNARQNAANRHLTEVKLKQLNQVKAELVERGFEVC